MSIPNQSMNINSRPILQEISVNNIEQRRQADKLAKKFDTGLSLSRQKPFSIKKKLNIFENDYDIKPIPKIKKERQGIMKMPTELLQLILLYLKPEEIINKIQIINHEFNTIIQNPYLWKCLEKQCNIPFECKYSKQKKIVERRSKGKLYLAKNRITGELHMIRKIELDIANAGKDDGVPTSVLREISFLSSLNSERIGTVTEAQVKGGQLFISFPYHRYNLKEYMKGYIENEEISGPRTPMAEKIGQYHMPLSKIKVFFLVYDLKQKIMYEFIQSVDYCHRHGVLHRNLKPDNIMITQEEHIVINDFSLSRFINIPHTPYTPEVFYLQIENKRIQKKEKDQVGKQEDYGIEPQNCYSEKIYIHLKWIYGLLAAF